MMSVRSTTVPTTIPACLWLVAGVLVSFSASVVLVIWLQPVSERFVLVFTDVATATGAAVATTGIVLGALRSQRHVRVGLLLIAAGLACWTVGEWGWSWYDYDTGEAPFPSWLDGFYLAGYPFLVAGAVVLASPGRALARVRTMLDGLALVAAVTAVMWYLVLAPTYRASDASVLERAVGGAYPLGDLFVFFAIVLAISQPGRTSASRAIVTFLSTGIGIVILADTGYAYLSLNEITTGVEWLNVLWTLSYVALAGAAAMQLHWPMSDERTPTLKTSGAARQATPLLLLAALIAFIVWHPDAANDDSVFLTLALVSIAAILIRQLAVLNDNARLNDTLTKSGEELESRVKERTAELSRLVSILDASTDFVGTADVQGNVLYVNRAGRQMVGIAEDVDVSEMQIANMYPTWVSDIMTAEALPKALRQGAWTGETAILSPDGTEIPTSHALIVHRNEDGSVQFVSNIARDISMQKELEAQLRQQAFHDPLTGLANRTRFIDRLEHALVRARRTGDSVALMFVDLDQFKSVNDSHGHGLGDQLLVKVGERLSSLSRAGDTVARLGGDEFAVLLDGAADATSAEATAQRLVESLRIPFEVGDLEMFAHVSVGLALATGVDDGMELLRQADLAMYTAKANGKDRFAIFDHSVQSAMGARLVLLNDLQGATERGEFILNYQPKLSIETGEITGVEALVRWIHPEQGLISPLTFIPIAEESGVIVPLGRWVMREACFQMKAWQGSQPGSMMRSVAVNVAARQLRDPNFVQDVASILAESKLDPACLTIEITESATMQDVTATIAVLNQLKELGVHLSIDDFGTGYSSLSYLRQFPFDELKIDKSFVDSVGSDDENLTSAIVNIAKTLKLKIVAEGVEQHGQLESLRALDCDTAQGYLFSRPVTAEQIEVLLHAARAAEAA